MAFVDWFAGDLITGTRLAYGAFYRATDVADLKSVPSADLKNGAICLVPEYGIYQYDSSDTGDEVIPYKLTADVGAWSLRFVDVNSPYSSGGAGSGADAPDQIGGGLLFRQITRTNVYLSLASNGTTITSIPVDNVFPGDFIDVAFEFNTSDFYFTSQLYVQAFCVEPGKIKLLFFSPSTGYTNPSLPLIIKIERYAQI